MCLEWRLGVRGERPAIDRLSRVTAIFRERERDREKERERDRQKERERESHHIRGRGEGERASVNWKVLGLRPLVLLLGVV